MMYTVQYLCIFTVVFAQLYESLAYVLNVNQRNKKIGRLYSYPYKTCTTSVENDCRANMLSKEALQNENYTDSY